MKLLLVEDNADDAAFLGASLRRQQASQVELVHVRSIEEARQSMNGTAFDVVLLDLHLPDATGLACVDAIQALDPAVAIVVLSGQDDEEFAVSILNKGVQDYLVKWEGQGRTILRSIRYAIERKRAEIRLNYLAQFDPLTEIGNRQYFHDQLKRATARARRDGSKVALFFLDIDQFKIVNDTLGHDAGDRLLQEVAQRLSSQVRTGDVMARLGGDEFAILMESVGTAVEAGAVAEKLLEVIDAPFTIDGHQVKVTTSIGITFYPADNNDTVRLLKNADIAMYQAKDSGRNNFKFFTERMHTELLEYHDLEHDIAEALRKQRLPAGVPAQGEPAHAPAAGPGGAAALGLPEARRGKPRPVHSGGRRQRPHRAARLLGAEQRLRNHAQLGAQRPATGAGVGERLDTAVPAGGLSEARGRDTGIARDRSRV